MVPIVLSIKVSLCRVAYYGPNCVLSIEVSLCRVAYYGPNCVLSIEVSLHAYNVQGSPDKSNHWVQQNKFPLSEVLLNRVCLSSIERKGTNSIQLIQNLPLSKLDFSGLQCITINKYNTLG